MKTYDRTTFHAARNAWDDGEFGPEWEDIRRLAAERGFLYPPTGTRHDDREAENPSQRAIVYRALADNPNALRAIVLRSRSWQQVVDGIFGLEDRLRREAGEEERDAEWDRDHDDDRLTYRESVTSLRSILRRIGDS